MSQALSRLDTLVKRDHSMPPRIVFYGPGGVGKTTTACDAPNPIVIQTEDGLGGIPEVPAFPIARTLDEYKASVQLLINEEHNYKTLIIDSADWLDKLVEKAVCKAQDAETVASIPYGKGGGFVHKEWTDLIQELEKLRSRGMLIVFTAHSHITTVNDPVMGAYDKMTLKMHKLSGPMLEEWADIVFYCDYDVTIKKQEGGFKKDKGQIKSLGGRIMRCVGTPALTAKNRYSLPEVLPLSWQSFEDEYRAYRKARGAKSKAKPKDETTEDAQA